MKPTPQSFSFDEMYEDAEIAPLDFSDPDYRALGMSEVDQPYRPDDEEDDE